MINQRPLFPGDSEIDELFKIFRCVVVRETNASRRAQRAPPPRARETLPAALRLTPSRTRRTLGTPTEATWPGVSQLPDFKNTFPQWHKKEWAVVVPTLCATGCDLLSVRGERASAAGRPPVPHAR